VSRSELGGDPGYGVPDLLARHISRRQVLTGMGVGAAGIFLAACSSTPAKAPSKAAKPSKPVSITLWHSMTDVNLTALQYLTHQFNTSQHEVTVTLVNQSSYTDTLTAYEAALSGGPIANIVQMESHDLQLLIDSDSVVPVESFIDASHYLTSDYLPSAIDYFRVRGTLWALPFAISGQILYYNKLNFDAGGLDSSAPPSTLAELEDAARTLTERKVVPYGMALSLTSSTFKEWLAMAGQELVNHGNGRTARATAVEFDGPIGERIADWYATMYGKKWAQASPPSGSEAYDNLLAIGSGTSAMTISTSATLGTVLSLLSTYPKVRLGVGPLPGPNGTKGVYVGGSGLYIVKTRSTADEQAGAWEYIQHLCSPASQAYWAAKTGYVPVRQAAASIPVLANAWTAHPEYKVAFDQILSSPVTAASSGEVVGPADKIGTDLDNMLTLISEGKAPAQVLKSAASQANSAIAQYNSSVGA